MRVELVDLAAQYQSIRGEIDSAIQRILDNTSFILGDEVRTFEAAWAQHVGAAGAVGVSSGTAALELSLRALDIGPGDEVITTAHTFIATAEAITNVGARPVFADIDPVTYNLDPSHVEDLITDRTRAIMPVHLYGQPADLDALMEIAERRGLWVIEDAAQAHGAEVGGRRCGSIGHLACFSFYPGKNLGAYGDAGAVTGNDPAVLDRIRRMRDHGRTTKYEHVEVGYAERIDALQAAILGAKLPHLEAWTEARRRHADRYDELLSGADVVDPGGARRCPARLPPLRRALRTSGRPPGAPEGSRRDGRHPLPDPAAPPAGIRGARLWRRLAAAHRASRGRGAVAADLPGAAG